MKQKKKILLQTAKDINRITVLSGIGFLACLGARGLKWDTLAGLIGIVFTVLAGWAFFSAMELREKDREAASYNMIWGTGALTLLLGACAAVQIKIWFGL